MIRLTALIEKEGQSPLALSHESNARSIVLGRDPSADFQIPLPTVSRHHARISESDHVYLLEDLGSVHGTSLNGVKLQKGEKKVLKQGDVLQLSKATITIALEHERLAFAQPEDTTQVAAMKAVKGILGRLGESQQDGPFLRVLSGPSEGEKLALAGDAAQWTAGRTQGCEWILPDTNVSRRHFTVRKDWHGFTIEDAGSKNGTLLNNQPLLKPTRLQDKDEITIGPVKIIFIDPDAELLSSLKHVPGFAPEKPQENPQQNDPLFTNDAPQALFETHPEQSLSGLNPNLESDDHAEQLEPLDGPVPQQYNSTQDDDEAFADIDPELLQETKTSVPWGMLATAAVIVGLSVAIVMVLIQK